MSVRVMSWVWDHSPAEHAERLVLLAIADNASDDGTRAWPSVAEIGRKTLLSERAIQGAVKSMCAKGWLIVGAQAGPHGCNRYTVVMTPAESAPPQNLHPAESADTPAESAPPPPQILRDTPAESAPVTVLKPSKEPSKNHPETRARPTRLDPSWMPPQSDIAWATRSYPGMDLRLETDRFRDHWRGKPGQGGTKLDWAATWRNWIRRAPDFGGSRASPNGRPSTTDQRVMAGLDLAEEYRREAADGQAADRRAIGAGRSDGPADHRA